MKQTNHEKAKAEFWREYHKHVVCGTDSHRYWFDKIFDRAYQLGKERNGDHIPDATKKIDRAMIAAMAMQGILGNQSYWVDFDKTASALRCKGEDIGIRTLIAREAVGYADALIAELGEKEEE